jgi:CheY-like chemotaxis protein
MDIWLPGISGIEALAQLRTEPATRDIPVIAVTASRSCQFKGLHHPVPVYRVLWLKSAQPF